MDPWKRDYRKRYGVYLGIKIPPDFDVHHIDSDPNRNDFKNLVAIPKELHIRYHDAKLFYEATERAYGYEKANVCGVNPNDRFRFRTLYGQKDAGPGFLEDILPAYFRLQMLRRAILEYKKHQKQGLGEQAFTWKSELNT